MQSRQLHGPTTAQVALSSRRSFQIARTAANAPHSLGMLEKHRQVFNHYWITILDRFPGRLNSGPAERGP
jgi:hypothetical protein